MRLLEGTCSKRALDMFLVVSTNTETFTLLLRPVRLTELPRGWQPIVNSSGRLARVAKVALDSKGSLIP